MNDQPDRHQPGRIHRVLSVPNLVSVAVGLVVFWRLTEAWRSIEGMIAAAAIGGGVTALVWIAWVRVAHGRRLERATGAPILGHIPFTPGAPTPTLVDAESSAAAAYHDAVAALEAATRGQVIMVAGASPGMGATTVAINLAVAATRMGRRVVLIDADPSGGLSEYGRSDADPGWADIAAGSATLEEASRLWHIDDANVLPVIPSGSAIDDREPLATGMVLAASIDELTEHADLLVLNSAPFHWDTNLKQVATHADGTVLVVTEDMDTTGLAATEQGLAEIGAPVIGYVVNRAVRSLDRRPRWKRSLKRMLGMFLVLVVTFSGWNAYRIWDSWRSVERDSFNQEAIHRLPVVPPPTETGENLAPEVATAVSAAPVEAERFQSFMLVGSDIGGYRADVIMLVLLPSGDSPPIIVSLPRDLYLPNRCTQGYTRLNANLNGCGSDINGPTLLATAVEDFTGIPIDHFALFTFKGFEQIIDQVGGIEICLENPVRDRKAFLNLPAGCTNATGAQALSWVRSRRTLEYVNGRWRAMAGVSDLTRNQRQQDVILAMLDKIREFNSPQELSGTVRSLSNAFTLDDQLGISDAIALAWGMRNLKASDIVRLQIPVRNFETKAGSQVLVPTVPFDEILSEFYAVPTTESPK